MKYFVFRKDMIVFGVLMWVAWLPAQWVTSAYVVISGCEIETVFLIRWLCEIFGIFAIDIITPILRVGVVAFVLVVGAFIQGVYGQKTRRRLDIPFALLGIGMAYLNSFRDYAIAIGMGSIGVLTFNVGIPLVIIGVLLLYWKIIFESKKMEGSLTTELGHLVSLGVIIASTMKSMEGFQMVMSFLVTPMFLLSGALFPLQNASDAMKIIS